MSSTGMGSIVVTGAAGCVGSMVCQHLLAAGFEVVGFDRLLFGAGSLAPLRSHPRFRLRTGDVRDGRAVYDVLTGAHGVVHLAALVGEAACDADPDRAWTTNVDGTLNVRMIAAAQGVERAVFASTCSNYGASAVDDLLDEDAELNPLTLYARSKVESEQAWLADDGVVSTVLRFGTICGISPRTRFDLLVNEVAARSALGQPIELYAPGAWRPYLHVRDAASAVIACLAAPAVTVRGLVANVVGENLCKRDLGALVLRVRPRADVRFVDRAPDRRDYRVRGARLAAAVGFEPTLGVQDAFVEVAEAVAAGRWADPFDAIHTGVPPARPIPDPSFVSPNPRGAS